MTERLDWLTQSRAWGISSLSLYCVWEALRLEMPLVLLSVSQFSHSVVSDSLQPHEPQHARPPCPSLTPRVHPNPCPLSRWCHPTIFYRPLLLLPSIFPSIRVFLEWVSSSHQVAKVLEFLNKVKSFGVRFSAFCSYDTIPLEQNFWFTLPELGARQWWSHGVTSRHLEQGAE